MDTAIAGAPVFVTLAPLATVSGETLGVMTMPLLSLPVQVTAVPACVGSGEHWAQA